MSLHVAANEFQDVADVILCGGVIANEGNLGKFGGIGQWILENAVISALDTMASNDFDTTIGRMVFDGLDSGKGECELVGVQTKDIPTIPHAVERAKEGIAKQSLYLLRR